MSPSLSVSLHFLFFIDSRTILISFFSAFRIGHIDIFPDRGEGLLDGRAIGEDLRNDCAAILDMDQCRELIFHMSLRGLLLFILHLYAFGELDDRELGELLRRHVHPVGRENAPSAGERAKKKQP